MKITRKETFAFCFNICLVLLTVIGIVLLTFDSTSAGEILKYYTTDSNLFIGLAALLSIIYTIIKWNGKIKKIPSWVNLIKLMATATVTLTMIVTITILTPSAAIVKWWDPKNLYIGSNLIYHVVSPIVAIVTLLLFEDCKDIKLLKTLYCLIPTVIYAIFYIAMVYTHINPDGSIMDGYDWYGFASFGPVASGFIAVAIVGLYYLFTWLLWFGNRKIKIKCLAGK